MGLIDVVTNYYKFDESSGDLVDAHGGKNLTAINSPGTDAGGLISSCRTLVEASAQGFKNTTDFDILPASNDVPFSWHTWVYPTGGNGYRVFQQYGTANWAYELYLTNGGPRYLSFYSSNLGLEPVPTLPEMVINTWNRVAMVYDGASGLTIVLNDETPYSTSWTPPSYPGVQTLRLGFDLGDSSGFEGRQDETGFFYDYALTTQDLDDLWNGGAGLAYPFGGGGVPAKTGNFFQFF